MRFSLPICILLTLLLATTGTPAQTPTTLTCGFDAHRTPARAQAMAAFETRLRDRAAAKKSGAESTGLPYVVPVVVHVIHNGGPENIPDAQILAAIDHLNQGFAAQGYFAQLGATTNTQIQFCPARQDPAGNATTGITRTQSALTDMVMETDDIALKDLARWDPERYVNIWIVGSIGSVSSGPGVAGYAYFPSAHGQPEDGLVCEAGIFGTSPSADAVLIHEMGHYLALYHTFEGGCYNDDCTSEGDRVCDTPPDNAVHTNCQYNSCPTDVAAGSPFATDVDDYTGDFMDYSPFPCYHFFTPGQAARMQGALETARASLLESPGCREPCTLPVAASFSVSDPVLAGQPVALTNTSAGATTFSWRENGVEFAQTADATRTFNTPGFYGIELRAGNSDPNCFDVTKVVVAVKCPVAADLTASALEVDPGATVNFTNASTGGPTTFDWSVNGVTVASSTDFSYTFANPGYYIVRLQVGGPYCSAEKSLQVHVKSPCGETVPAVTSYWSTGTLWGVDMTALPDGSAILCGESSQQPVISRLDAAGNVLWHRQLNVAGYLNDIEPLPDGTFILSGKVNDRFALAHIDAAGNVLSLRTLQNVPSSGTGFGSDNIVANADGSFVFHFGILGTAGGGGALAKMAPDGTVQWAWRCPELSDIGGLRHVDDGTGHYLVSSTSFTGTPIAYTVMRFDQGGNLAAMHRYDLPQVSINITMRAFLGSHPGGDFSIVTAAGTSAPDVVLHKYIIRCRPDGQLRWAKKYATAGDASNNNWMRYLPGEGWAISDHKISGSSYFLRIGEQGVPLWQRKLGNAASPYHIVYGSVKQNGLLRLLNKVLGQPGLQLLTLPDALVPISCLPDEPKVEIATDEPVTVSAAGATLTAQPLVFAPEPFAFVAAPLNRTPLCVAPLPCPELCANGLDDDDDGYVDCFDADCPCDTADDCTVPAPVRRPVVGQVEWESTVMQASRLAVPLVANLNPAVDTIPEILIRVGNNRDSLLIFRGDGSNKDNPIAFKTPALLSPASENTPMIADIDRDGSPELLITTIIPLTSISQHHIRIYRNYEENPAQPFEFWFMNSISLPFEANNVSAADFDHDGTPELFCGNRILAFDFSNPAAPDLQLKLTGTGHRGQWTLTMVSAAADVLNRADCNGDPDCDGLELVAGATIYSVDLDVSDGDGLEIKIQRDLNTMLPGENFGDGLTQIADIDLDGVPDVVVNGRRSPGGVVDPGFYAWNKNGLVAYFPRNVHLQEGAMLTIANVFDDRTAGFARDFPEIVGLQCNPSQTVAWNVQAGLLDPANPSWWRVPSADQSCMTYLAAFDFDSDGWDEPVIRGDNGVFVLYGGPLPLPAGVDPVTRAWFGVPGGSITAREGPAVADVDGDGEVEIVFTYKPSAGYPALDNRGWLRVVESASLPWPPARPFWNQFSYSAHAINDDLTIPQTQQKHWLEMGGIGSGWRPYNTHLTQVNSLDPGYLNTIRVPDAAVSVDSTRCRVDSFDVFLQLCNFGSATLPAGTPLAFYAGDPTAIAAPLLFPPVLTDAPLEQGGCRALQLTVAAAYNQPVFIVVNDDGSVARPFDLETAFPATDQPECQYANNVASFELAHATPALDLGPDRTLCKNSIVELVADPGFARYRWHDGSTDPAFTAFSAGLYWVQATDACGFRQSDTVQILLNLLDTLDLPATLSVCAGETVQLTATGFTQYAWAPADSLSCADCTAVHVLATGPITVYLTARDGQCFVSDSVQIEIHARPAVALVVDGNLCDSLATLTAAATGAAPFVYLWSNAGTDSTLIVAQDGLYTVEITDAFGCRTADSTAITIGNLLALSAASNAPACFGASTGAIDLTASGGSGTLTFAWSNGATTTTAEDLSGLPAGTYTVTATDANGCTATLVQALSEPPALELVSVNTPPGCFGASSGAIDLTASGGSGALTFAWSNGAATTTAEDLSGLPAGTYTVTATDANGCTATLVQTLSEPPALELVSVNTPPGCFGASTGAIDLTASGGSGALTFAWSNAATTEDLGGLPAGTYTVTATDANGCTATLVQTLAEPPALSVSLQVTDADCPGSTGSIDLLVAGGTPPLTYAWSNGAATPAVAGLAPGPYSVTVLDVNGCARSETAAINVLGTSPDIVVSTDTLTCAQTTGVLAAGSGLPGTVFFWTGPGSYSAWGPVATVTIGGSYAVTATAASGGCTAVAAVFVPVDTAAPLAIVSTDYVQIPCGQSSTVLSAAGSSFGSGYSVQWTAAAAGSILAGAQSLSPTVGSSGWYTLTTTDLANGCTATNAIEVAQSDQLAVGLDVDSVRCFGEANGAVRIVAVSGGTPPWSYAIDNQPFADNPDFGGLPAGQYVVRVRDAAGCVWQTDAHVGQPPPITVALTGDSLLRRNEAGSWQAAVSPAATGPVQVVWSGAGFDLPMNALEQSFPLPATTLVTVQVVDAAGCTATSALLVRVIDAPGIYAPNAIRPGSANGTFTLYAGAGVARIEYLRIFDRWGELVFSNEQFGPNDERAGWTGEFRGRPADAGVYVWMAGLRLDDGSTRFLTGDLTVLR